MISFIKLQKCTLIFLIITLINAVFFYSYPMNVANFDYAGYLGMIHNRISNLILASGYPAIMLIFTTLFDIPIGANILDVAWLFKLQLIQLVIHIANLLICFVLCAKIFNKFAAVIMCIIWGLSTVFMASVNAGAPEWIHGELIILSFLLSAFALNNASSRFKIILYAVSWVIFCASYLVKFNSLILLPALLVVIAFDKNNTFSKIKILIVCVLSCYISIFGYIKYFHAPTAKTKQLSYDHAWVLIDAIPDEYFFLPLEKFNINTLRWLALSAVLPTDYALAGAYCCIDAGAPENIRLLNRVKYDQIMFKSKFELIYFLHSHPLPKEFVSGASAIPIYWYIGLKEADSLGIEVYKESLFIIPEIYVSQIINGFLHGSAYAKQTVPFYSNKLGETLGTIASGKDGFVSFKPPPTLNPYAQPYYNPSERVWGLGVQIFEIIAKLIMPRWLELIVVVFSILGIIFTDDKKVKFFGFLFLGSILIFFSASFVLLGMRTKEFTSITPLLATFYGLGLSSFYAICRDALHLKSSSSNAK